VWEAEELERVWGMEGRDDCGYVVFVMAFIGWCIACCIYGVVGHLYRHFHIERG